MGDKSPKKRDAKKPGKSLKEKRAEKHLKGHSSTRLGGSVVEATEARSPGGSSGSARRS